MRKYYLIILTLFTALTLAAGCQKTPQMTETPVIPTDIIATEDMTLPSSEKTPIPTPESEKSKICGTIVYEDQSPFDDDTIYLAPVYEGTAIVLDTSSSPGAKTDENGFFCTSDIEPGDFVLVIGSPEVAYEIYSEDGTGAVVFTALSGKILDFGTVVTNLLP